MINSLIPSSWKSSDRLLPILGFLLLAGLMSAFYASSLNRMPGGIHDWAQGDRLALAINFYDYGFNFWKPRTFSITSIGGVTGVEFPLQAYLAALGGLIFGRNSINFLFRLLDVSLTLAGAFYLFRIVFERTQHWVAALVPGCFLLSSSVFAYYAGNYLPDPASLSISFIGYYYWLRFFDHRRFRDLVVGIAILTLAALIKTTTALHLSAVLGGTLVWVFFHPDILTQRQKIVLVALSATAVGSIGFFFYHNQQLNTYYQAGLFLARATPIQDADQLHMVQRNVQGYWAHQYATRTQYRMLWACAGLVVAFLLPTVRRYGALFFLLLASLFIGYVFFWLMGTQLEVHDYYIITSFMPAAVILLLLGLLRVAEYRGWMRWVSSIGLLLLLFVLARDGFRHLRKRMERDNYAWLHNAPSLMQQAGVPPLEPVLVLFEKTPNTALVYLDRHGLSWYPDETTLTADALESRMAADGLEYVVMSKYYYQQLAAQPIQLVPAFRLIFDQSFVVLRRRNLQHSW